MGRTNNSPGPAQVLGLEQPGQGSEHVLGLGNFLVALLFHGCSFKVLALFP